MLLNIYTNCDERCCEYESPFLLMKHAQTTHAVLYISLHVAQQITIAEADEMSLTKRKSPTRDLDIAYSQHDNLPVEPSMAERAATPPESDHPPRGNHQPKSSCGIVGDRIVFRSNVILP